MSEAHGGWLRVPLGEVASFVMGQAPPGAASNFDGNGTIFVKAGEFGRRFPVVREWTTQPLKYAKSGDVLICVVGATAGKLNLAIDCAIGRSVAAIRPSDALRQDILYYQLIPKVQALRKSSTGSAQGVISSAQLANIPVDIPPASEQTRIAAKLDAVLAKIDVCRERLDRVPQILKRFREAVLEAAVSGRLTEEWRVERDAPEPEADVALDSIWDGASYGSAAKSHKVGKVPVLRMGNIQNGALNWSDLVYTSDVQEIEKYKVLDGDVLFNRTNSPELVGKTAVFHGDRPAAFAGYLIRVRCGLKLHPDFLGYCLNSPAGRHYCWTVKTDGVSQSNINASKLGAFRLLLPSMEEQREIVRRVDELFALANSLWRKYEAVIARVEKLTPSVLAKAFRGGLVPQDPNDEPAGELLKRIQEMKKNAPVKKKGRIIKKTMSDSITVTGYAPTVVITSLLADTLKKHGRLSPDKLLQATGLDIDEFYDRLKAEMAAGCVREVRKGSRAESRWLESVK